MKAAVSALEFLRKTLAYPDWRGTLFYGLLRAVFAAVPVRRKLVLDALKASFPEKDHRWRKATLRGIYRHFSWMIVEFLAAVNNPSLVSAMVVQVEGRDVVDTLKAEKKGCFILTGHFSNWEICGAWMPQNGYPMMPAVRDSDDPDFAELIEGYRNSLGEKTLRKGAMNVRRMVRLARSGNMVALLADQDAGPDAVPVTFLSRRTTMVEGPAALSLMAGVPLITIYALRLAPFKYKIVIKPPLATGLEGRSSEHIAELTRCANEELNRMVLQAPEQWFWFHRRWKTDPDHPGVKMQ
ncbi:MAG: lysophospholipid acyltransferase family protein [Pyramidobacter sp.]|jgi:KDO2-lipid IV(A) lauroyltransferase